MDKDSSERAGRGGAVRRGGLVRPDRSRAAGAYPRLHRGADRAGAEAALGRGRYERGGTPRAIGTATGSGGSPAPSARWRSPCRGPGCGAGGRHHPRVAQRRAAPLRAGDPQVEALIAGAYLAGTNTRRVQRALAALFRGAVGKDVVSRTWRKVKMDWEAWCRRDLAGEDIVRLILDGTVVRVRAGSEGHLHLPAGRPRHPPGRPEGAAGGAEHGRRERGRVARRARRPRRARPADAGVPDHRRRRRAGAGARRPLARCAGRSGARSTSTGTCWPTRRRRCTRRSRPTTRT